MLFSEYQEQSTSYLYDVLVFNKIKLIKGMSITIQSNFVKLIVYVLCDIFNNILYVFVFKCTVKRNQFLICMEAIEEFATFSESKLIPLLNMYFLLKRKL